MRLWKRAEERREAPGLFTLSHEIAVIHFIWDVRLTTLALGAVKAVMERDWGGGAAFLGFLWVKVVLENKRQE